ADGKLTVKRQTEFGYDVIEAPAPAVIAVSHAINEPRYPALKGVMGAEAKAPETASVAAPGVEGLDSRPAGDALRAPPHRGARPRRLAEDRGRRERGAGRSGFSRGEASRMSTLVFLEHHGDELLKSSLGVLSKAAALDGDVAGVVLGTNVRGLAEGAGKYGAA